MPSFACACLSSSRRCSQLQQLSTCNNLFLHRVNSSSGKCSYCICWPKQGRIQPVRFGGRFQEYLVVKSHYSFTAVRDMKFTSQYCNAKTTDGKIVSRMLFSEFYKIMVNKVTFVGFRLGDRPLWIRP